MSAPVAFLEVRRQQQSELSRSCISSAANAPAPSCRACEARCVRIGAIEPSTLYSCPACGLRFVHPQPSIEELGQIYTAAYPGCFAIGDQTFGRALVSQKDWLANRILRTIPRDDRELRTLLDVGCGTGELVTVASRQGWDASGLDIRLPLRAEFPTNNGGCFRQADWNSVELEPSSFDVVVLCETLEHLQDPLTALRRLRRVLKPGGWVVLTTPDAMSLPSRLLGRRWFHYHRDHLWYFSKRSLDIILERAELSVRDIECCWKRFTPRYVLSILQSPDNPFPGKELSRSLLSHLPRTILDCLLPPLPEGIVAIAQRKG